MKKTREIQTNAATTITFIRINGVEMPVPAEMSIKLSDLQSFAERGATGVLLFNTIRRNIHTINVRWSLLSQEKINIILSNINSSILVEFYDLDGTRKTANFYASDRAANIYNAKENETGFDIRYKDFGLELIEI